MPLAAGSGVGVGFSGGSRAGTAAALPRPAQQPLLQHRPAASEIERGLAAEIREAALLRRGELWAEHRDRQTRPKGAPSSPLDAALAPCPGSPAVFSQPPRSKRGPEYQRALQ